MLSLDFFSKYLIELDKFFDKSIIVNVIEFLLVPFVEVKEVNDKFRVDHHSFLQLRCPLVYGIKQLLGLNEVEFAHVLFSEGSRSRQHEVITAACIRYSRIRVLQIQLLKL